MSSKAILSIGIDGDHPLMKTMPTAPSADFIRQGIADARIATREAGFTGFRFVELKPETCADELAELLKERHWDALIIGGGFKLVPGFITQLEDVVNTTKNLSPKTQILFTSLPSTIIDSARRVK